MDNSGICADRRPPPNALGRLSFLRTISATPDYWQLARQAADGNHKPHTCNDLQSLPAGRFGVACHCPLRAANLTAAPWPACGSPGFAVPFFATRLSSEKDVNDRKDFKD